MTPVACPHPAAAPRPRYGLPRHARHRRADEGGYSVLEAAITLPVIVFLLMAIVQWAIVWHARGIAQAAAQEGLRTAAAYGSSEAAGQQDIANYIAQVAPHALTGAQVDVSRTADTITVRIHAAVPSLIPFGSFSVTATAAGPAEVWSP